ncbi:MAG TPA: GNAT family N-acetyltransferase [Chloroflexia bacterium]|nr:GNAT family N-acetyltransferase [Chloroflexia bacterium]
MPEFKIVQIVDGTNKAQVEQFVTLMQHMYDYHATLHDDWKTRPGWQSNSQGWINRAAGGDEFFFALAYPVDENGEEMLERPAGYITGTFHYEAPLFLQHRFGYIADLWVEEAYRGGGAARLLLENAINWFKQQGVNRVQLEVDVNNALGQHFWEKAGFEPFEIVMRKDI